MLYVITRVQLLPPDPECAGFRAPGEELSQDIRKREDAALLCLERAVWQSAHDQGLLDTRAGHRAMAEARAWTKRHPIEPINLLNERIYITAV